MQVRGIEGVLVLDEMQLRRELEYHKGLKCFLGRVSNKFVSRQSEEHDKLANHALVFMLRGLTTNWKQVIAYYLTDDSVTGTYLWQTTKSIIVLLGENNINVRVVALDY